MIGKAIVNAALQEDFSLEYKGQPIAKVHQAGFANPYYTGTAEYLDKKTADQMLQVRQLQQWIQFQTEKGKQPNNQEIADEMNRRGIEIEYYEMRHAPLWAMKNEKGVVTAVNIMDIDHESVQWELGKVIFRPKTRLPHWLNTILNVIYFIIFLAILAVIHNAIS